MTFSLFELFSFVLMVVIVLFGIGVLLALLLLSDVAITYFMWRRQEKKEARKRGQHGET